MTILPRHKDVAKSRLKMSNPWHLLAVGFGSGLSPIVPGTMGSLAAIPFWYLMTFLPWQLYSLVVTRDETLRERLAPCHFNQPMGRIYWYVDHAHGAADQ